MQLLNVAAVAIAKHRLSARRMPGSAKTVGAVHTMLLQEARNSLEVPA